MSGALARGKEYDHPILDSPGWWRRIDRFSHPPANRRQGRPLASVGSVDLEGCARRALLITGATGTLGTSVRRICKQRGIAYHLLSRTDLDIADADSVGAAFNRYTLWAVVNTAGYVRVDDAQREVERCMRENVAGPPILLARAQAMAFPCNLFL